MNKADNRLKMAQLAAKYREIGINKFPKEYIGKYCPYVQPLRIHNWFRSASNVWNGRNSDATIIEAFEKAYEDAKNDTKTIQNI